MRIVIRVRPLLIGALFVGVGACGSASGPATAKQACIELQEASARRAARCSGGDAADWRAFERSFEDCAVYDKHVADGKVQYQRAEFAACLASLEGPCDRPTPGQPACRFEVLRGLVADGESCRDSQACGPKSACLMLSGESCGEVCMSLASLGQTCGIYCGGAMPCFEAAICEYGLACVGNICVKSGDVGQPCGGPQTLTCTLPLFCSADLVNDPTSTGVCTAPVAGGPCRSDSECPQTQFCLDSVCSPRREAGMACVDAPTGCVAWTACDASLGTCVTAGGVGEACAPYPGTPDLPYCFVGTCIVDVCGPAPAAPGQSCVETTCALGSTCDPSTATCVACAS
jgi:hypothetical protein